MRRNWLHRLKKGPVARGLTLAALEGAVVGGMFAFVEAWMVPLLKVRLHTSDQLIGLLTVAPMLSATLLGPIAQPIIARLGGNKRTVTITCIIQVIAILGLSIPLHLAGAPWAMWAGLSCAMLVNAVGAVGGPAWMAWMGGMIPRSIRGRFTSNRAQIHHAARIAFALLFMGIMSRWTAAETWVGLQILIVIAVLSRIASTWLVVRSPEMPNRVVATTSSTSKLAQQEARDFATFMKSIHRSSLGRWTLVWAALHFGVMLAGPYFLVYWLETIERGGLGLADDPLRYTILVYTSAAIRLAVYPLVGRLVDHFGPTAMLRFAVAGIALVPMGWALTTSFPLLILTEMVSGFSWCIAECSVGVLLFSCSNDGAERARFIGYHQTVCALVIVVATLLGGQLLVLLPEFNGSHFRCLFLVSTALRLPAVLLALRWLPPLHGGQNLRGVWRLVPGLSPTITLSRGVMRTWRRPLPPDSRPPR